MSVALVHAKQLKPEIRLAQAVSEFEADLSDHDKAALRKQRAQLQSSPPDPNDVIRLTAEIDRTSGIVAGRRCFGPRMTNFLQAAQQFAALGDVVVGGSQNLIACSVWMLIRMSLLSIASYSSYLDKLSTLFMDIGRSAPRYQAMALLYPQSKRLQADLTEYFILTINFCHRIWKFAQKSAVRKFVEALSDADLKTYESNLRKWASAIKEEVDFLLAKKAHEISYDTNEIKTIFKKGFGFESHQNNLRKKLWVLDLCSSYDFQTTWKQTQKKGHCSLYSQSTEYQSWRDHTGSSTLIYTGKLGSGKSVLLANIVGDLIVHFQQKHIPVAYFFCRYDISESLTARTVLGSLARQLLMSTPDLAFSKDLPAETISHLDIEEVCSLLHKILPSTNPAYIVVDGLDECEPGAMSSTVEHLQKLQRTIDLHLCFSIRTDPSKGPLQIFKDLAARQTVLIPDDNPDIEAYIDAELENFVFSGKLKLSDPVLVLDIQRKLMEGSQGMFLWVALQLQSLCMMKTDDSIRKALDDLPKDLPETFVRILQRSQDQDRTYQQRILEFALAAYRPLTVEEFREALGVIPGDTTWRPSNLINDFTTTLACCGGLVIVDEEETTVRLVHHSFEQFLFEEFQDESGEKITRDRAHKTAANVIVTYLNYGVFDRQISTMKVPRMMVEATPSQIVQQTIGSSTAKRIALKLLKSRKQSDFDIGNVIVDAGGYYDNIPSDHFHFYEYAKSLCWQHILQVQTQQFFCAELLIALIEKGLIDANPTVGDETPLTWAVRIGNASIVERLINADKTSFETNNNSVDSKLLALALQEGHKSVVKTLFEFGIADVEEKWFRSQKLFSWAAENRHAIIIELILEAEQIDINPTDGQGKTALSWATQKGDAAMVQLLLEVGTANSNMMEKNGWTVLNLAAVKGHATVVKLLLEFGKANPNIVNDNGWSPLASAVIHGHTAVVKLLLEVGKADPDIKDNNGWTTLHRAAFRRNEAIMKLLLDIGRPNVNIRGDLGETPLKVAQRYSNEAVIDLLISAGAIT